MRGEGNKRVRRGKWEGRLHRVLYRGIDRGTPLLMLICGFESLRIGHVNDDKQLAVFLLCGACFQPLSREQTNIWWERKRDLLAADPHKIGSDDNLNFGFLCRGFPNGR